MKKTLFTVLISILALLTQAQYISEVLEYKPAPGQFVNAAPWGVPESANSIIGGINGSLTLGAFGGYVVFRFEEAVSNHSDNPFGVDFTIFGNPLATWCEPGIVSVMKDENGNGLPDDTWYELAGSDHFLPTTIRNYSVTYFNPDQSTATDVLWEDNQGNSDYVYANSFHTQPYYPDHDLFPAVDPVSYTLSGTRIQDAVDRTNPSYIMSYRRAFGYVDNQLRGAAPYTLPDNPYTPEKENAGADAFDISWAIDENGDYVCLDEIHFIKVHNGNMADAGWLGEVSTEITGAVRVTPDASISGETDMIVIMDVPAEISTQHYLHCCVFHNGILQEDEEVIWSFSKDCASIDEANLMTVPEAGEITITAAMASNPSVTDELTTTVNLDLPTSISTQDELLCKAYPNPASDLIYVETETGCEIYIFSVDGRLIRHRKAGATVELFNVSELKAGMYIIRSSDTLRTNSTRLIKY